MILSNEFRPALSFGVELHGAAHVGDLQRVLALLSLAARKAPSCLHAELAIVPCGGISAIRN